MSGMIDGRWVTSLPAAEEIEGGRFVRMDSLFRDAVSADPSAKYPAEAGRYHLFVAWGCPWAARTLAVRALKGLTEIIPAHFALAAFDGEGWTYDDSPDGPVPETYPLHRYYSDAVPNYTGKVTVPTLWDSKTRSIVSNESSEIIRMMGTAFDGLTGNRLDLYPADLRPEIDRWNDFIYPRINNGVYRSGFATSQDAYDEAVRELFGALDAVEHHLETHRYLAGAECTEADWRLFCTLVRFDGGYYGAFKCNLRRIEDYPQLSNYLRELYQWPGIAETVWLERIKSDYYGLVNVNPSRIVPIGPTVDLAKAHDRARLDGRGIRTK